MARRPLSARPLDLVYFCFFVMHLPASSLVDLQALYPKSIAPAFLQQFIPLYIEKSGDPLIASAFHLYSPDHAYVWFRSFIWLEFLFQVPVFVLGARGIWRDSASIYILLLIYGASTSTTLLPCLATILAVPTSNNRAAALTMPAVTDVQRLMLLATYVPFLVIPLVMTLDMAWRLSSLVDIKKHPHRDTAAHSKRE